MWEYAWEHDLVVVTTNARDFFTRAGVDLHPWLIVLRESGLVREEQWQRLSEALDFIFARSNPEGFMVNRIVEVLSAGHVISREIPTA